MTVFLVTVIIVLLVALFAAYIVLHDLRDESTALSTLLARRQSEIRQMIDQLHDKQVEVNAANEARDELEQAVITLREQMKGTVVFHSRQYLTHELLVRAGDPEFIMRESVRRMTEQIADMITKKATTSRWSDTPHNSEVFEVRVTLADLVPEVFAEKSAT